MSQPQVQAPPQIELVRLAGGGFRMGADAHRRDERPSHEVWLPPFRAALRPVSNREYRVFVGAADHSPPPFWGRDGFDVDDVPVVGVSWEDAVAFCGWLESATGVPYRLPTEAEREYAARGGLVDQDWPLAGNDWPDQAERAEIARADHPHIPSAVCRNEYGLYCMADNVHEWCSDWYDRQWYASSPSKQPTGPAEGRRRASRGGSWRHRIKFTRVSARSSLSPAYRYNDYGFRVYADV